MAGGLLKRGTGARKYAPNAEINVTPMVDVMLVLLIIFMVTAPMLTVGVPVELPKANAPAIPDDRTPVEISIKRDGTIYVQERVVTLDNLVPLLMAVTESNKDTRLYVRGDAKLDYGQIMGVMGAITSAGFKKVALVALPPGATAQR